MKKPNTPIKKIKLLDKVVSVDVKEFFTAFTKAGVMYSVGRFDTATKEIAGVIKSFHLEEEDSHLAYKLVRNAFINASHDLIDENRGKLIPSFDDFEKAQKHPGYKKLLKDINSIAEGKGKAYSVSLEELKNPKELEIFKDLSSLLAQWFDIFKMTKVDNTSVLKRLPSYFVLAMHNEWRSNSQSYAQLFQGLDSPMYEVVKHEFEWDNYYALLEKYADEPVFDEAFSLSQIYIPLNAYYIYSALVDEEHKEVQKFKKVIALEDELNKWIETKDMNRAIKVISGGPGSGKSSSVKMWASQLAQKKEIKTLFIPLHLMNLETNMMKSVTEFIALDNIFSQSPLDLLNGAKLLIIFDGLDELSQQGKIGATIATQFVREIQRTCLQMNKTKLQLLILISGRELVIQNISSDFRQEGQILHLLPYYLDDEDILMHYTDGIEMLKEDKRNEWWKKYGMLIGKEYPKAPEYLSTKQLLEITSQPLLNYLVALSVKRGKLKFDQSTNLNEIYYDLITGVYDRAYENQKYSSIQGMEFDHFIRVLEEISIAAWHGGDVRTATVNKIHEHIEKSQLTSLFNAFQEKAKSGITRLLTAFYFREAGMDTMGNKSFEFTHKSFGEYLVGRRLVDLVLKMVSNLKQNEEDLDTGWDERTALYKWLLATGETAMDNYIFQFVLDEIKLKDQSIVIELQERLSSLFSFNLIKGFDFRNNRKDHLTEVRISRNAEESLFIMINCCVRVTKKTTKIKWTNEHSFSAFISRMQPYRQSYNAKNLSLECCSFLGLKKSILVNKDLQEANLQEADLQEADLQAANLHIANLQHANLQHANLYNTDLQHTNLQNANLKNANLLNANLTDADLTDADLTGADLTGADLTGADLTGADLTGAILKNTKGIKK